MGPIQMRDLKTFSIERLCFDLKLEVLEQLKARDVIALAKVNQGFQLMISSRPSIVFGHHVDTIEFRFNSHGIEAINIKKLNWKSLEVSLDVAGHFAFIKNIRTCNQLWMGKDHNSLSDNDYVSPIGKDHASFLKQLESVHSLDLYWCSPQHLELLSHLSIKIKRFARLYNFLQKAPSVKELVGHFIEAHLNECEIVAFNCSDDDEFQFYYNALIKTHIEYVGILCYDVAAIQRIVSHGIPSQHLAAVVRVCHGQNQRSLVAFLTGYPGMKRINRKNRQRFIALANDRSKGSIYLALTMKTLCFRRNINATRDCIYMLSFDEFLAFYIKPDEIIDR